MKAWPHGQAFEHSQPTILTPPPPKKRTLNGAQRLTGYIYIYRHPTDVYIHNMANICKVCITSSIPLACAETGNSLPFSGTSSILYYTLFPSTNLSSILPHFIFTSISWSTSQPCCFQIHNAFLGGILLHSILRTCPNQHNLNLLSPGTARACHGIALPFISYLSLWKTFLSRQNRTYGCNMQHSCMMVLGSLLLS